MSELAGSPGLPAQFWLKPINNIFIRCRNLAITMILAIGATEHFERGGYLMKASS